MLGADMSSNSRFDVWALRETETGCAPGTRYLYSNVGYRALGFVVEAVTGLPYAEALRRRVLRPLGLESTDPDITNEGRHRLAIGYERRYDDRPARRTDPWEPAPWLETGTGDGSLAGTMEDLAAFLRALLDEGHGLMAPDSFELMTTRSIEADDGWRYGYGLEVRELGGRRELRHSGTMPGFVAEMLGDRDAGIGVALAGNGADEDDVLEGIAETILDLFRDGIDPPAVPDPLAVVDAADYEGVYAGEAGRLELVAGGDRLFLAGVTSEPLEPRSSPGRFLVDHPIFALFLLDFRRADGRVVEVVHGGNVYRREGATVTAPPATPPGVECVSRPLPCLQPLVFRTSVSFCARAS